VGAMLSGLLIRHFVSCNSHPESVPSLMFTLSGCELRGIQNSEAVPESMAPRSFLVLSAVAEEGVMSKQEGLGCHAFGVVDEALRVLQLSPRKRAVTDVTLSGCELRGIQNSEAVPESMAPDSGVRPFKNSWLL
jgi:hypothetical protein